MTHVTQWMKRTVLLGLACSVTSGCMMYRLAELRNTTPSGTPFQNELSHLYMEFAAKEEKDYDWQDSWYFADKGLMLAYGKDAPPEELEGWNLSDDAKMELEKARIRVMDALTPSLKDNAPSRAAAIQFYFDCWVEQQEEAWQADDIAYCRDNLMNALGDSGVAAMPMPVRASKPKTPFKVAKPPVSGEVEAPKSVMPKPVGEKAAAKEAKKDVVAETASYAVFFEAGKPDVSTPGKNVLNEVVTSLKGKSDYVVILHVAPLAGTSAQEKDLPIQRITVVKKVLVEGGVRESDIVGADHVDAAKPVSRRVELFLNE